MSRNVPNDSCRVFTRRENRVPFHPSYEKKIDRFGRKGILVCGGMMLGNPTPLHVLDAGTVNSLNYFAIGMRFWKPM
ncbi:hypothetical protein TNCV_1153421 [Trichonephila clavipes]|nr:hypothetical protein TNCV_1153421 [Trichonephila clavipes]